MVTTQRGVLPTELCVSAAYSVTRVIADTARLPLLSATRTGLARETSERTMTTHDAHDTTDELDDVLSLVTQESTRRILAAASGRSCTAEELADRCDISPPTVYRHVTELQERGLLDEKLRVDESGDHVREFETTLESIRFTFTDEGANAEIRFR